MKSPGWRVVLAYAVAVLLLMTGAIAAWRRPLWFADQRIRFGLWRSGVRSTYVEAGGFRMHYFEAGAKSARPLVLVHGLAARGEDWAGLIAPLAKAGYHVYVPDLPGYGRSEKPNASYTIAYEEAAVRSFMGATGLQHADVAGWSMGGWISMKLTADHPELVDRLVLYDSAGVYFALDYSSSLFVPEDAVGVQRLFDRLTPDPVKLPEFVERDLLRRIQTNGWVTRRSLAAMTSGRDLMEFRLGQIRRPTLVVWGVDDHLIPITAGEKIAKGIPGARLVPIPGCGHLAPAECSSAVLPPTLDFLAAK